MCGGGLFGGGPTPATPVIPIRSQPKLADEGVRKARKDTEKKAKAGSNRGGTLITGPGGLSGEASTQKKVLLGQ